MLGFSARPVATLEQARQFLHATAHPRKAVRPCGSRASVEWRIGEATHPAARSMREAVRSTGAGRVVRLSLRRVS
jgi:hypothetical protein